MESVGTAWLVGAMAAVVMGAACAGGRGGEGEGFGVAPVLRGPYRFEATLRGSRSSGDIRGVLTFEDSLWVSVMSDFHRTRAPETCQYMVRGPRIETECGGIRIIIRRVEEGKVRADVSVWVPETYEGLECVRWNIDPPGGGRTCVQWDYVTRIQQVRLVGHAYLEREPSRR